MEHPSPAAGRTWKTGTLTYTVAGIVFLFAILLLGDFIWSFRERSVATVAKIIFKKFGASDSLNGILTASIPAAIGMALVPIISYHSDRFRSRFGRRIPYLLITTPIVVLGMLGMAFSPAVGEWLASDTFGVNNTTLLLLGIFWTLFEFGVIAGNAIFTALINDVVPRELLGRFYGLFRMTSLAAGMIFNLWLLEPSRHHYSLLFIGVGLLYGAGFTLMCFLVKEGQYPEPPPEPEGGRKGFFQNLKTYFAECYSKPYYLLVFFYLMMAGKAFMPINMYSILYAGTFGGNLSYYGKCIAISFGISFALSFLLGVLADRFHPIRCAAVVLCIYAVSCLTSGFLLGLPWETYAVTLQLPWIGAYTIDKQGVFLAAELIHCVVSGSYFTITASLPLLLLPKAKFAQFASASGIIGGITQIISVPIIGALLDWSGHDYRMIFYYSGFITLAAIVTIFFLFRQFNRYGGVKNYVAPQT